MLRGQGPKVLIVSLVALSLGFAAEYFRHKVNHDGILIASLCGLGQTILTLWICFTVARAKQISSNWGFIGLLGLFGVVALLFIPAKTGQESEKQKSEKPEIEEQKSEKPEIEKLEIEKQKLNQQE